MKVKPWQLIALLLVAAVVLAGGFYLFSTWQRQQPGDPVRKLEVTASVGEERQSFPPYTVCALDEACDGGEPPAMASPDGSADLTIEVPKEVASSSWRLLSVYDDPAANDDRVFSAGAATEATVPAVKDGVRLVVVEVSTLAVDTDEAGEEIPVVATWSLALK